MKKSLLKIEGVSAIEKSSQKHINGGMLIPDLCGGGCFSLYFCRTDCSDGDQCAVPDGTGGACFGTIQGGQCCI
ncbi:MAG: hypothetical protein AAFQ94_12250 [Bacteroidota bacterium]